MKVKELARRLAAMDQERVVVIACDAEGNGFCVLQDVTEMKYRDGEVGFERLTPELAAGGYGPADVMRGGKKAVIMYP